MTNTAKTTAQKTVLVSQANLAVHAFHQYAGRFDDMLVGRATKTIRTKSGIAMERGDLVLFEKNERGDAEFVTIWSSRTSVLTSVPASSVEAVS